MCGTIAMALRYVKAILSVSGNFENFASDLIWTTFAAHTHAHPVMGKVYSSRFHSSLLTQHNDY